MTDLNQGASRVVLDELRRISGARLYADNAFRLTGMPTHVDRATVRERRAQVVPALEAGVAVDLGHSLSVDADQIRAAFDTLLTNSRRRLVHELLWVWGTSEEASCGCPQALHDTHNDAVIAHSTALDGELSTDQPTDEDVQLLEALWSTAARFWIQVLQHASFWDHIRHRIATLDDKQLNESVIDSLRDELPITLVMPLVDLAVSATTRQLRLAELARSWPLAEHVVHDRLEAAAEPLFDTANTILTEVAQLYRSGSIPQAAYTMLSQLAPVLHRIDALAPPDRHPRTSELHTDAALALNNCAIGLTEQGGSGAVEEANQWFDAARDLAVDRSTVKLIAENRAAANELMGQLETIREELYHLVRTGQTQLAHEAFLAALDEIGDSGWANDLHRMYVEVYLELGKMPPPLSQRDIQPDPVPRTYVVVRQRVPEPRGFVSSVIRRVGGFLLDLFAAPTLGLLSFAVSVLVVLGLLYVILVFVIGR